MALDPIGLPTGISVPSGQSGPNVDAGGEQGTPTVRRMPKLSFFALWNPLGRFLVHQAIF